jgi:hypothetical protein
MRICADIISLMKNSVGRRVAPAAQFFISHSRIFAFIRGYLLFQGEWKLVCNTGVTNARFRREGL